MQPEEPWQGIILHSSTSRCLQTTCPGPGASRPSCGFRTSQPLKFVYIRKIGTPHLKRSMAYRGRSTRIINERQPLSQVVNDFCRGLDVGIIGIPMDIGTSNRPGTRFGPRQIRTESSLLRPCNCSTGVNPFAHLQIADLGDIPFTMYDIREAVSDIKKFISKVLEKNCSPVTLGGDHTIAYPILQAMKEKFGPVGLVHVDAHADVNDTMMDCRIAHGTPFRRAFEEGCLDGKRVAQIGLRGTGYSPNDYQWSRDQGFRVVLADECWYKSLTPLMVDVRKQMGHGPVYVSLDIDSLDPCYAPGTGTPEIGGLTTIQMLEIIRGLKGLNIVGGDMVEVSPPYDPSGNTALTAANMVFELLCQLANNKQF